MLYVSFEGLPQTVFDAQVVGFLRAMAARGLVFDLFIFERVGSAWRSRGRNSRRLAELRAAWGGRVTHVPIATRHEFPLAVSAFALALSPDLARRRRLVLHCRGSYSALLASVVKRLYQNLFFVFDVRGDAEAEFLYRTRNGTPALLRSLELGALRRAEGLALRTADHILCVSAVLRDRLRRRENLNGKGIDVVPSCADAALFRFDPGLRAEMRRTLGFEGRLVLVYAGSIYEWQLMDRIVRLITWLRPSLPHLHFLCLTPHLDQARAILAPSLPEDAYTLRQAPHVEMPRYLLASDIGVLIRERHPLNEVACPTKFAEYLMCGLPVLTTEGLGDLSDLVRRDQLGVVLRDPEDPTAVEAVLRFAAQVPSLEERARIAETGRNWFSWDRHAPRLQEIYERALLAGRR